MSHLPNVVCLISDIRDGSMSANVLAEQALKNRQNFLGKHHISPEQSVLVYVKYHVENYRRYSIITKDQAGDGVTRQSSITADALFTKDKNLAMVLPVADCIGAVLYDPEHQVLGLSHLGRHNLLQQGGTSTVEFMTRQYGTLPQTVKVWLSPSAGGKNYPLFDFDNKSLVEIATEQLVSAGVSASNIEVDNRDTTSDDGLFSHSEFLKGRQADDDRQMVVAMMRD